MKREHDDMAGDEGIEALLREVGARDEPSSATMEEVRRAVHDEWRAVVARRKRRRRAVAFGIAATVALLVGVVSWTLRFTGQDPPVTVTIARVDGEAKLFSTTMTPGRTIDVGEPIPVGSVLTTDEETRIALAYGAATSVRIDRGSRIERASPDRFRLHSGAIYVDVPPQSQDGELVIETQAGSVRHLGTQYQIRQANEAVEISIREGRVAIDRADGRALATAGERVRMTAAGRVERGAISAQDPSWDWAESTSPVFAIDDRTLAEFLEWVARETGRKVVYASTSAQRTAETLKLRGSIEGLDPDTALTAVLSTTELTQYDSGNDLIGIRAREE